MLSLVEGLALLQDHFQRQFLLDLKEKKQYRLYRKIQHIYGVLSAVRRIISIDESLSRVKPETRLEFELGAILHDIGRLHQYTTPKIERGGEYSHGNHGYDVLKTEGITNPRILLAVKHHDKFNLLEELENEIDFITADKDEKEKIIRTCTVVRDADKLEKLEYLLYDHEKLTEFDGTAEHGREERSVSETILDLIRKKQRIPKTLAETLAERLLCRFAWIFDIQHDGTKTILRQIRFRERFADILSKMGVRKEVVDIVRG